MATGHHQPDNYSIRDVIHESILGKSMVSGGFRSHGGTAPIAGGFLFGKILENEHGWWTGVPPMTQETSISPESGAFQMFPIHGGYP